LSLPACRKTDQGKGNAMKEKKNHTRRSKKGVRKKTRRIRIRYSHFLRNKWRKFKGGKLTVGHPIR